MTFNTRLAGNEKALALWVTIAGVERIFKSHASIDASAVLGETREETACLYDVNEGGSEIDFAQMAQVGGGLSFKLRQPFGQTFLSDIFQPRKRRQTWVTADVSLSDTQIDVASTTGLAANQIIYIGQEAIKIGTVFSATRLQGCTRAMYGTRAQKHKASSSVLGSSVYTSPPSWVGRRVTLRGSFLKADGSTSSGLTQTLGTFTIEENPTWEDGERALSFRCGPLMDEYANRAAYVGFRRVDATAYELNAGGTTIDVDVSVPQQFIPPDSNFPTFALLTREGRGTIARLYSYDDVGNTITVGVQDMMYPPGLRWRANGSLSDTYGPFENGQHIALLSGSTGQWALWVLCSRLGDNANGAYDVLPGRERTNLEDPEYRMGCGILAADVDLDSFNDLAGDWVTFPLMKQTRASEILYEACLALDAFAYVKSDGKLALQRMGDNRNTPVLTLDSSYCIANERPKVYVDEESIAPVVKWRVNFDPAEDDFDVEHITIDSELLQRFPTRDEPLVLESRAIGVDIPRAFRDSQSLSRGFPLSLDGLDQKARSLQARGGRGRLIVERAFKIAAAVCRIGDVVTIGFEGPDCEGGSINGRLARVVGRRPQWRAGRCDLTLEVFESVYRLAPSAVITAVDTASLLLDRVTLSTTAPDAAGSSPTDDFHVGQTVRIWGVSAGTSTTRVISSIPNGTQLVFTVGGVSVETGRDWLTWGTLGTSSGTTAAGDDESDWLYFMASNGVAAEGPTRRWQ